ncbi:hypothetical protein G6O67_007923 [Ophiocordyceps sinensis]|uniref:Uncharacterized protein n=1 Tax=Ophiocordyceps sinensis TaxID=72228 RepID=A0A8H4PJD0_9HYPO|nr:hypothetical protein G6O67_007923 [Ophiocordyceps sinensis]
MKSFFVSIVALMAGAAMAATGRGRGRYYYPRCQRVCQDEEPRCASGWHAEKNHEPYSPYRCWTCCTGPAL